MTDFAGLLEALASHRVRFILVGGVAATLHGSSRLTQDVDIVYDRSPDNIANLVASLDDLEPYLRGAPPGLPFHLDAATVSRGLNFTLTTRIGDIDIFGEIVGGGTFAALLPHSIEVELYGFRCLCLDLPTLIMVKRAAGRPRDLETVAELERILEEQDRQ